jgi:hypothetical protein
MHWGPAEWIALIALGVAVVALPPVFQMFWGRPQVEVEFKVDDQGNLLCDIYNRPVSNSFLVWLRVRRETACITVGILIQNANTKEVVLHATIPSVIIGDQAMSLDRINLPPSHSTLSTMIVQISGRGAGTYNSNGLWIHLPAETYRMEMTVIDGEKRMEKQRNFVVTAEPKNSYWAGT